MGDTWTTVWDYTLTSDAGEATRYTFQADLAVVAREDLVTPAGTFDALRIEQYTASGTFTWWLGRNAGPVQYAYTEGMVHSELVRFEP